ASWPETTPSNSPIVSFKFHPHAFARHWRGAASWSLNIWMARWGLAMDPTLWRASAPTANLYQSQGPTAPPPLPARPCRTGAAALDVGVGLHSAPKRYALRASLGLRSGRHPRPDRKDETKPRRERKQI